MPSRTATAKGEEAQKRFWLDKRCWKLYLFLTPKPSFHGSPASVLVRSVSRRRVRQCCVARKWGRHGLLSWSVSLRQANRSTCQKPALQFTSPDSLWDVERKPGAFFSRTEFVLTQESKRLQKCFAHDEELTSGAASFPAGSPWVSLGFGRP